MHVEATVLCSAMEHFDLPVTDNGLRNYKFEFIDDPAIAADRRLVMAFPLQVQVDNPALSFTVGRHYHLAFTTAD